MGTRLRDWTLLSLSVVGVALLIVSILPNPLDSSWIVAALPPLGYGLTFTCLCLFAAVNPQYRTINVMTGTRTIPTGVILLGPIIADLGWALVYAPALIGSPDMVDAGIAGVVFILAGGLVSFVDVLIIAIAWRQWNR